jgi:hypothetical protein
VCLCRCVRESLKIFWLLLQQQHAGLCCNYTQQHQDISSLSLPPPLFNLPISLLSSSSFSPLFAPAIRRAIYGGANHQPKLPPPPFSFFFFFNFFFFFFHLLFPSLFASFASSRRAAVPPVLGVELTFQIASKQVKWIMIMK